MWHRAFFFLQAGVHMEILLGEREEANSARTPLLHLSSSVSPQLRVLPPSVSAVQWELKQDLFGGEACTRLDWRRLLRSPRLQEGVT